VRARIVDRHGDQLGSGDADALEEHGSCGVAVDHFLAPFSCLPYRLRVGLDGDIGDPQGAEHPGHVASRETEAHQHGVAREPHLLRPPLHERRASGQPSRDRRSRANQEGGRQQGEHGPRDEDLLETLVEESGRPGDGCQDEGELTGLGEVKTRQDPQAEPLAKHEREHRDDDPRLQQDCGGREEEHAARLLQRGFGIEEHPHGGEEDAEQHTAKRNQLGEELMTVGRRVHREPGEEGADRQGQPDSLGGDGGPHHHQHRHHAEQLLGTQLGHPLEHARQEKARHHEEDRQSSGGTHQGGDEGEYGSGRLPGEKGNPQQEEDDAEILKEEDTDGELTLG
jgi:hypothetical protein